MYKVFINDSSLIITAKSSPDSRAYRGTAQLKELLEQLEKGSLTRVCLSAEKPGEVWEDFKQNFKLIEAAGGLVFNTKKELLMIYRLQRWDLPKGKIESGENAAEAALREVEEECGISASQIQIVKPLPVTYHTYRLKGQAILKQSHWFLMNYQGREKLVAQVEEDIARVVWCPISGLPEKLKNTYGNIRDLLQPFL